MNEEQIPCPKCGVIMAKRIVMVDDKSTEIDVCIAHGIWLDNGELDDLIERTVALWSESRSSMYAVQPAADDVSMGAGTTKREVETMLGRKIP